MSKEKQILLLYAEGCSQRTIAARLKASRNTVASVIAAAKRACLQASQIAGMEEKALTSLLFPEKELEPVQVMPDCERIHRELLWQGVTLRLFCGRSTQTPAERPKSRRTCIPSSASITVTMSRGTS